MGKKRKEGWREGGREEGEEGGRERVERYKEEASAYFSAFLAMASSK